MTNEDRHRPDAPAEAGSRNARLLLCTWDDGEAEMIRQLLESYGIPVQMVSDVAHSVYPITLDGLGEVRILVPENKLAEARALLDEHRRHGLAGGDDDDEQPTVPGEESDG